MLRASLSLSRYCSNFQIRIWILSMNKMEFFDYTAYSYSFRCFFVFSFLKMIRPLMGWAEGSYSFQVVFFSSHISNFWADARRSATKLDEYSKRKNMVKRFWERRKSPAQFYSKLKECTRFVSRFFFSSFHLQSFWRLCLTFIRIGILAHRLMVGNNLLLLLVLVAVVLHRTHSLVPHTSNPTYIYVL